MEAMAVFGCYANTLEQLSFNTQQSVDSQGFQVMVVGSVTGEDGDRTHTKGGPKGGVLSMRSHPFSTAPNGPSDYKHTGSHCYCQSLMTQALLRSLSITNYDFITQPLEDI